MSAILVFGPDGIGNCLYTEAIDLSAIGQLHITRASRIEYDNYQQLWVVFDLEDRELFAHPFRQHCLDWEQERFINPANQGDNHA